MNEKYRKFKDDFISLCKKNIDKDMIIYDTGCGMKKYTYGEVLSFCKKYAELFHKKGLSGGDCIVVILPNSPEAAICFFAALLCGIHYAPLPCMATNREFDNWIQVAKPKLIIKKQEIADFKTEIPVVECACDGNLDWVGSSEKAIEVEGRGSSNIFLMTSGTTGVPKAMSINADKLWSSGCAFVNYYHLEERGLRFWNYLPMSYLGGLFNLALIPLCCEGSFVVSEPFSGKTVLNFWNYVKKYGISALWFVPSIVQGLLKLSKLVNGAGIKEMQGNVKIAFLGTATIQLQQKQEFEETFGIRLLENFALSETTFLTAESESDVRYREQGSVGVKLPYVRMKFQPVNDGSDICTIWVKTPYLFNGYLSVDGAVDLNMDADGFFNTKDLGRLNADGLLILEGRDRDIIKKGGLFVSLAEIENAVCDLIYVEEVAAVPIEHDFYGESYCLCVIPKKGAEKNDCVKNIHLWMLDNFVSYKMPEKIIILEKFPRTASGKIQKKEILGMLKEEGKNE